MFWGAIVSIITIIFVIYAGIYGQRRNKKRKEAFSWSSREEQNLALARMVEDLLVAEKEDFGNRHIVLNESNHNWLFWKRYMFFEALLEFHNKCDMIRDIDFDAIDEQKPELKTKEYTPYWPTIRDFFFKQFGETHGTKTYIPYGLIAYLCNEDFSAPSSLEPDSGEDPNYIRRYHKSAYLIYCSAYLGITIDIGESV